MKPERYLAELDKKLKEFESIVASSEINREDPNPFRRLGCEKEADTVKLSHG